MRMALLAGLVLIDSDKSAGSPISTCPPRNNVAISVVVAEHVLYLVFAHSAIIVCQHKQVALGRLNPAVRGCGKPFSGLQ
jgi:hypothetical protein